MKNAFERSELFLCYTIFLIRFYCKNITIFSYIFGVVKTKNPVKIILVNRRKPQWF